MPDPCHGLASGPLVGRRGKRELWGESLEWEPAGGVNMAHHVVGAANRRGCNRGAGLAVLATIVVAVANVAAAQMPHSRRDLVRPERAERMEALVSRSFPGAALDWDREQLVYADGRRVAFTFRLYEEYPQGRETLVIASRDPDERQREALRRLQAFQTLPADVPPCTLSLMRADASGSVLDYKESIVDIESVLSVCDRASLDYAYESAGVPPPQLTGRPAPTWPYIFVNVTTAHAQPDMWAVITWAAVLDTNTLEWVSRLPVFFNGMRRNRQAAAFAIKNDRGRAASGAWVFSGFNERGDQPRWQFSVPCKAGGCVVEPQAVLDAATQSTAWK